MESGPVRPLLIVQLDDSDPPARLGDWLRGAGAHVVVCDVAAGDDLPPVADIAGLVVLGGPMGANDDDKYPFLRDVKELLRAAVATDTPVLGVCLGGQLLAAANGGRVERMPDGPEIGAQLVAKRTTAAADPLFGPLPIAPDVIQWHYDEITVLPPGAVLLAGSPVSPNQAFRLGRLAWGVQFHIETTPEIITQWAREDASELADYDLDGIVARAVAAHDDVAETWAPFAAAFVGVVTDPDSVAPSGTVPSTTAEPVTDPAAIRAALAAEAEGSRQHPTGPTALPMPTPRPRSGD